MCDTNASCCVALSGAGFFINKYAINKSIRFSQVCCTSHKYENRVSVKTISLNGKTAPALAAAASYFLILPALFISSSLLSVPHSLSATSPALYSQEVPSLPLPRMPLNDSFLFDDIAHARQHSQSLLAMSALASN